MSSSVSSNELILLALGAIGLYYLSKRKPSSLTSESGYQYVFHERKKDNSDDIIDEYDLKLAEGPNKSLDGPPSIPTDQEKQELQKKVDPTVTVVTSGDTAGQPSPGGYDREGRLHANY